MIEREKTYLVKQLPDDLKTASSQEIIDLYMPFSSPHPKLRVRKNGNIFEMTKKTPLTPQDRSTQEEQTIKLSKEEFDFFLTIPSKRIRKIRYYYPYGSSIIEFDIFQEGLRGLILADIEFTSEEEKKRFTSPSFLLSDVTQEDFIAGGMLCGKTYTDIAPLLENFNYTPIIFEE